MGNAQHTNRKKSMHTRRQFIETIAVGAGAAMWGSPASGTSSGTKAKGPAPGSESCWIPAMDVPVIGRYDVLVCGGGPSGTTAALAAKRAGLSVMVIEGQGQLGGTGVSGMVSEWLGGNNGGIFHEFATETKEQGISRQSDWGPAFDPFAMALYLDKKMSADGIDVLLHTQCVNVQIEDNRISHVIIFNKSGFQAVAGKAIIDATGDADIAARSGCKIVKGRKEDGLMTPTTLIFHVSNVDETKLNAHFKKQGNRLLKQIEKLTAQGEWPFPYNRFITRKLNENGVWMVNTIRLVGLDGTNGRHVSEGMVRGRKEAQKLMAIFRKHVPGYENARIKAVAPFLGIRETRRISADYMMTIDDLAKWVGDRSMFKDVIGFSTWGFDLPNPKKPSVNPGPKKKGLPRGKPIPYRVMVPRPIKNLICPGRSISVERMLLGSLRVMSPCMTMGQAAGQAASQVVKNRISFADVNVNTLIGELKNNGVRLG
jgi:hypothetical protein